MAFDCIPRFAQPKRHEQFHRSATSRTIMFFEEFTSLPVPGILINVGPVVTSLDCDQILRPALQVIRDIKKIFGKATPSRLTPLTRLATW